MKLNKDTLYTYLERTNVNTGSLKVWYGFNQRSGNVLFNEALGSPSGDSVLDNGCLDVGVQPALLVGSGANSFSFDDGSGYFDSESVFKIGPLDFLNEPEGFTLMVNLQNFDNSTNLDLGKTIISTMENASDTSGFSLGINGTNRVYFHFADLNGNVNKSIQSKHEINNYSVISISYKPAAGASSSYYDYAVHDITNIPESAGADWSMNKCYGCVNTKASNTMYVGDYYTPSPGYTGYKGHIGDILIFSQVLNVKTRQEISKAIFTESITPASVEEKQVVKNVITQSGVKESKITGIGITGYEKVEIVSSVPTRDGGNTVDVCETILSGVTGAMWGEVITYETGVKYVTGVEKQIVPETINYGVSNYSPYSKKNILFFDPIDENEIFEIYSLPSKTDKINRATELEFSTPASNHSDSPISICEKNAIAMCTESSWSGKVCYPCNKYTGESSCGDCYQITGVVDGPCEPSDTCESGFASMGDCRKFAFEECIRRFDAPVGSFNLRKTIMPSAKNYYNENYNYINDRNFATSGGNLFVNGILTKEGVRDCEDKYTYANTNINRNVYKVCGIKSGTYTILDDFKGFYSGTHSFNIRYRYDLYDPTGYRIFNTEDFIYIPPDTEFVVFDESTSHNMAGTSGETQYIAYASGDTNLTFSATKYLNKDIYLNGLKLVSGHNFSENSEGGIDLIRSTLPAIDDAELAFVARPNYSHRITGSDVGSHKNVGFDLLSEQIWINGLRQVEGVNYIKTSQNSLLNTDTILKSHNTIVYSNSQDFFNQ